MRGPNPRLPRFLFGDPTMRKVYRSKPEPVYSKPRTPVGLFAQLSADQQKRALAYNGPEHHGDPAFLKSRRTAPKLSATAKTRMVYSYELDDSADTATILIEDETVIEEFSGVLDQYGNPIMYVYEKDPIGFYLGEENQDDV